MTLVLSSNGMSGSETTESAEQLSHGLTNPLPLFKLISDDILVNIFSRLEEDPRHLARIACVCRIFAHVVKNVCWKRRCTRIVPEIMPSPQTHLDQIPEPPGGWGALMKLLVCCPGMKHAGIVPTCWDFGLERELGPTELYETQPRYAPKRRTEVDNVQGNGRGELTIATNRDASVSGAGNREFKADDGNASISRAGSREFKAANGDSSIPSDTMSIVSSVLINSQCGEGSSEVDKPAVKEERGTSFEKDPSGTVGVSVQGAGHGELKAGTGNPSVQCNAEFRDSSNGLVRKCLIEGNQVENPVLMEKNNGKSLVKSSPAVVDTCMQGTGSGESKAANGDPSIQSTTEVSNDSVAANQVFSTGGALAGMPAVTEKSGRSTSIDPSSTVRVPCGSERPPRNPVKRVHWKEEDLASKADKDGSKLTGPGEAVIDTDRKRSRKRKERALRRLLAKIPEDPKHRLHIVPAEWTLPREEGSRLLASRFRCDSLYICDWPGCVHPGEKRNYKLFRGFFKNFKTSLTWRNLKDMNARQTNTTCAFCSSTSTWDMMTAFCLRRSFEYHDDGEPVVHASVCENGHVFGAWTDRPGVFAAL